MNEIHALEAIAGPCRPEGGTQGSDRARMLQTENAGDRTWRRVFEAATQGSNRENGPRSGLARGLDERTSSTGCLEIEIEVERSQWKDALRRLGPECDAHDRNAGDRNVVAGVRSCRARIGRDGSSLDAVIGPSGGIRDWHGAGRNLATGFEDAMR